MSMSKTIWEALSANTYPGRGILCGLSEDGRMVSAYFIMGRSENSRNRIFTLTEGKLRTKPFDEKKVEDPSLIIYTAMERVGDDLVITNGDQTDTVVSFLKSGKFFEEALMTRTFEPDRPNFTPRISALQRADGKYSISILKAIDALGEKAARFFYHYEGEKGTGHLIHTYEGDGNPLPSFRGEPVACSLPSDPWKLASEIWESLNEENRISLYVRYTDMSSGEYMDCLYNEREEK